MGKVREEEEYGDAVDRDGDDVDRSYRNRVVPGFADLAHRRTDRVSDLYVSDRRRFDAYAKRAEIYREARPACRHFSGSVQPAVRHADDQRHRHLLRLRGRVIPHGTYEGTSASMVMADRRRRTYGNHIVRLRRVRAAAVADLSLYEGPQDRGLASRTEHFLRSVISNPAAAVQHRSDAGVRLLAFRRRPNRLPRAELALARLLPRASIAPVFGIAQPLPAITNRATALNIICDAITTPISPVFLYVRHHTSPSRK